MQPTTRSSSAGETFSSPFRQVCAKRGARLIEMDDEDGHVHLLVEYPPKFVVTHRKQPQGCVPPPAAHGTGRHSKPLPE
ncbi:transposase [Yanghanlia caeni]|uniref:transposase n=1 Tax=Yanghanlia caeni TaxID=3064283 RepID=UPI003D2FF24C